MEISSGHPCKVGYEVLETSDLKSIGMLSVACEMIQYKRQDSV